MARIVPFSTGTVYVLSVRLSVMVSVFSGMETCSFIVPYKPSVTYANPLDSPML